MRAEALVGRVGLAQSGPLADSKSDASVRAEDADPVPFPVVALRFDWRRC